MSKSIGISASTLTVAMTLIAGCGGGESSTPAPPPGNFIVSVAPSSVSVEAGVSTVLTVSAAARLAPRSGTRWRLPLT